MTQTRNHFTNPVGYALCVGVNNFSSPNITPLKFCKNDVEFWTWKFETNYNYEVVRFLLNENATYSKFVWGIWGLAARAQPGDIVTITISSHGEMDINTNIIKLYDKSIDEKIFRFLLRAFKPRVRVFVVTDACESGTFIDPSDKKYVYEDRFPSLKQLILSQFPNDKARLDTLFKAQKTTPLSAHTGFISSSSDDTQVKDGALVDSTKNMLFPIEYQSAARYRNTINDAFISSNWDEKESLEKILYFRSISPHVKISIDKLAFEKGTYFLFYLMECLGNEISMMKLFYVLMDTSISFDNDKGVYYDFCLRKILYSVRLKKNNIPVLSFHGQTSKAFQNQFIFAKKYAAFTQENMN